MAADDNPGPEYASGAKPKEAAKAQPTFGRFSPAGANFFFYCSEGRIRRYVFGFSA